MNYDDMYVLKDKLEAEITNSIKTICKNELNVSIPFTKKDGEYYLDYIEIQIYEFLSASITPKTDSINSLCFYAWACKTKREYKIQEALRDFIYSKSDEWRNILINANK